MTLPKPAPGVVLHELPDGTHALTDGAAGEMLVLNDVGAAIWLLLDACESTDDLCSLVVETLGAPAARVRVDVDRFLQELATRGFIE